MKKILKTTFLIVALLLGPFLQKIALTHPDCGENAYWEYDTSTCDPDDGFCVSRPIAT